MKTKLNDIASVNFMMYASLKKAMSTYVYDIDIESMNHELPHQCHCLIDHEYTDGMYVLMAPSSNQNGENFESDQK